MIILMQQSKGWLLSHKNLNVERLKNSHTSWYFLYFIIKQPTCRYVSLNNRKSHQIGNQIKTSQSSAGHPWSPWLTIKYIVIACGTFPSPVPHNYDRDPNPERWLTNVIVLSAIGSFSLDGCWMRPKDKDWCSDCFPVFNQNQKNHFLWKHGLIYL